jgi:O-antigen/teichoic acid export membrane protein
MLDRVELPDRIEASVNCSIDAGASSVVVAGPTNGAGSHFRALGRNVFLKNLGETSRLFQMAFFVVSARRFGPAALGNLTALMMIGSGVGLLFGDLGINTTVITRMCGRSESERKGVATEALFWKNVLSALALLLMFGGMYLIRNSGSWTEVFAVVAISLGGLWIEFLCALTNGVNRLDAEAWLRIVFRGAVYGGGALVALFVNLAGALVFMAVATIVIIAGAFLVIRRDLVPLNFSLRPTAGPSLLKESVPVWVTQLAQLTFLKFDVVILGLLHVATRETGWYAAAWKIADVLTGVPALLSVAALPLMSGSLRGTNVLAIAPKFLKAMYVLPFLFALPLAIGAEWITRLLYGEGFAGTPRILQILVWAVVPFFVHMFLTVVAVATRRQSEAAKFAATTSILGMVAAVILVPKFGYEAMAVICLVANSVFACAMIYRFRDVTGTAQSGAGLKSLISALGIYGLCSIIPRGIHPVLMMVCGTAAYCIALLLLRVISLRDLDRVWRLVGSLLWNRSAADISLA